MELSKVKGGEAFSVAGNLLGILGRIMANKDNAKAMGHNLLEFFGAVAQNTPEELKQLIALRRGEAIADEDYTATRVINEINALIEDQDIVRLFS